MLAGQNEAFSRILIDKALEFSGWDLLNPQQVHFELQLANGRADYLLRDKLGRVLCVLEAKREGLVARSRSPDPSQVSKAYLFYALKSVMDELRSKTHGTTMKHITKGPFERTEIPVPPLAEQRRLVKQLDEADALRKLRAEADRRMTDLIPALFHEMFGDVATNSRNWPTRPFGELAKNEDGRRKPVRASDRANLAGEYPYYGASGIINYVDEYLFDETALLIAEDGANLLTRSTPIAFIACGKYWVNNHAHVVTGNNLADLIYLCAALNFRDLKDYVTGSAQPKLNQANLNRMAFPVPPFTLQKTFADRVTEIRALEAEQAASRRRHDDLFQSMLHRAFSGEL